MTPPPIPSASITDGIGNGLSEITSVLALPVLIAAAVILVLAAFEIGRFTREVARRRRGRDPLSVLTAEVVAQPDQAARYAADAPSPYAEDALLRIGETLLAGAPEGVDHALDDYEHIVERQLDRTRMLVRAGPAIGLMGTLIPLAPGLKALGDGDIALLADDLRIAFAATTIGLLAGTVAFALTLARTRRWTEDLAAMERATERLRGVTAAVARQAVEAEAQEHLAARMVAR